MRTNKFLIILIFLGFGATACTDLTEIGRAHV